MEQYRTRDHGPAEVPRPHTELETAYTQNTDKGGDTRKNLLRILANSKCGTSASTIKPQRCFMLFRRSLSSTSLDEISSRSHTGFRTQH